MLHTEKLKEIGQEMNSQDHRSTHMPLFVIEYEDKVICPSGFGDDCMLVGEEGEISQDDLCEECCATLAEYGQMEHTIECEECGETNVYHCRYEDKFDLQHGVFLTEKACDEYIRCRSYEMKRNAHSYAISAHWSKEMQYVLEHLSTMGSETRTSHQDYTI
jgi:hypothetical protein